MPNETENAQDIDISFREKRIYFVEADVAAFSAAMRREFPNFLAYTEGDVWTWDREDRPYVLFFRDAATCSDRSVDFLFDGPWRPVWRRRPKGWRLESRHYPNGTIDRCWVEDRWSTISTHRVPPHISFGRVYLRLLKGNKEHEALGRRVFRVLRSVATTAGMALLRYDPHEFLEAEPKGQTDLVGHHARAWLLADPERYIWYGRKDRLALRPIEGWNPPPRRKPAGEKGC